LLINQIIGVVAVFAFVVITTGALFLAIKKAGLLRVSEQDELEGLDVSEHGVTSYGADLIPQLATTAGAAPTEGGQS
jgi:Amt family ammonium transporter